MCNMEAHDYMILLTCGLRRPGVSRERRGSNLDQEIFSYLVTFVIPSKYMLSNTILCNQWHCLSQLHFVHKVHR